MLKDKLLMDYCGNYLNISEFVAQHDVSLPISARLAILSNIANGLRFLAKQKIVHMDLNLSNILVSPSFLTKIIDFGESYCSNLDNVKYSPGFTNPFGPPEVFNSVKKFSNKSDTFSFGMILYYLVLGKLPFCPTPKLK